MFENLWSKNMEEERESGWVSGTHSSVQGLVQVLDDVLLVLQPHRETDQGVTDAQHLPLLLRYGRVGHYRPEAETHAFLYDWIRGDMLMQQNIAFLPLKCFTKIIDE